MYSFVVYVFVGFGPTDYLCLVYEADRLGCPNDWWWRRRHWAHLAAEYVSTVLFALNVVVLMDRVRRSYGLPVPKQN